MAIWRQEKSVLTGQTSQRRAFVALDEVYGPRVQVLTVLRPLA